MTARRKLPIIRATLIVWALGCAAALTYWWVTL